jgi:hypothetical protein
MVLHTLDVYPFVNISIQHLPDQVNTALAEWQVGNPEWMVQDLVCRVTRQQ